MPAETLRGVMSEKNITKYQLSKKSGIPWATLSDICNGKADLEKCSVGTVRKLANALGMTIEEVLDLETGVVTRIDGLPEDQSYLECDLPPDLQKAIDDYTNGMDEGSNFMDCLWGELYGSINSNYWEGAITERQAEYLRSKYLGLQND